MPSSGARSGTNPSRSERGAGTGKIGPDVVRLTCGHETNRPPLVTGAKTLYSCPQGCGLVGRRK